MTKVKHNVAECSAHHKGHAAHNRIHAAHDKGHAAHNRNRATLDRGHVTYNRDAEYAAHDRVQTPCYGSGSRTPG